MNTNVIPPVLIAALAGSLAISAPAVARAQPGSNAESAQVRYRQATESFSHRKFEDARRILVELWSESRTYDVAVTLVQVEYQLGHYGAAANYLQFALANVPPTEKLAITARMKKDLEQLAALTGQVRVSVDEPDAEVSIDGRIIGRTPIADNTYLDPGVHTVAGRIGKRVVNKVFSVEKGRTADMELVLPKEVAGATAPRPPMVPVTKQSTPASTPDPGASQAPDYTLPIVVGATGAAALFTGAVMLVVASSKASRREDLLNKLPDSNPCGTGDSKPAECSEVADLASGAATFRTVAIVSFGTTLAAGVATYILWPKSRDTTSTELIFAPSYSPHRNLFQLGASGRF